MQRNKMPKDPPTQNMHITMTFDDSTELTQTIMVKGRLNPNLEWTPALGIKITNIKIVGY